VLSLRDSAVARLAAIELAVAIVFIGGVAIFAGRQLEYQDARRNTQLVTREIERLADTGDAGRVRGTLVKMREADYRIAPDIVYALFLNVDDCVQRGLDTIGRCAELKLWTPDVEGERLHLARVLHRESKPDSKPVQEQDAVPSSLLQPDIEGSTGNLFYKARPIGASALLLVGIDRSVVLAERRGLQVAFVGLALLYVLVAMAVAATFMMRITRRIRAITGTLQQVAAGELSRRIELADKRDEIDTLGSYTNAMLDRLAELISVLQRFAQLVEHELGNAMARIGASLQNMTAEHAAPSTRGRVEACLRDLDEAKSLLLAVGELTRADTSSDADRKTIDLAEVATDLAEMYSPIVEDNGQKLVSDIRPVTICSRPALLQRLIANLLDNAIKYSGRGATIRLLCGTAGTDGFLEIADNGPGLGADEWDRVLELGVRGSNAVGTAGKGIGLYFVRALAAKERMGLRFEDAHPGVRVHLTFPAGPSASDGSGSEQVIP
jgi:signal transduction histidine kinase